MNKREYIKTNRPEFHKFKNQSQEKRFHKRFGEGVNAQYERGMKMLEDIKREIQPKIKILWDLEDRMDEINRVEDDFTGQITVLEPSFPRQANRRKTEIRRRATSSSNEFYSVNI